MRFPDTAAPLTITRQPLPDLDADVVVVAAFDKALSATGQVADAALGGRLASAMASGELATKAFSVCVIPTAPAPWKAPRVLLVGLGPEAGCSADQLRKWAIAAALVARERRFVRAAFVLPGVLDPAVETHLVAEGVTLAAFNAGAYKNDVAARPPALEPSLVVPRAASSDESDAIQRAVGKGYILGSCSNLARTLVNEPSNRMTPRQFVEVAEEVAAGSRLKIDVLDEDRLAGLNMGLLLGVARGSAEPPRLVMLRYDPPKSGLGPVLGLVGKGVTFDSGGISIKTAEGMYRMKSDMSGGAAVLAAMKAIAALGAPVPVVAVIPLVENMPSGTALKPGDVLRGADGRTVEVLDTDAEGRLILGDALWYASYLGATHLVDVATLTGACVVALGRTTSGLFGAPASWASLVHEVTTRTGDRSWVMPVFDDYKEQLRSDIADLSNIGGRAAGSITAALFLKEFAAGLPWVHMDIAGTAWADDAQPYQPKGPTGVAVRTLAELAICASEWAR